MLLSEDPLVSFPLSDLCSRLMVTGEVMKTECQLLLKKKILVFDIKANTYSLNLSTPEVRDGLRTLVTFDRQHPVTLITYLYKRKPDTAKQFADAFKFKKENT